MQIKLSDAEGAVLERARAAVGARSGVDVVRAVVAVLEREVERPPIGTPLCDALRVEVTRRAEAGRG